MPEAAMLDDSPQFDIERQLAAQLKQLDVDRAARFRNRMLAILVVCIVMSATLAGLGVYFGTFVFGALGFVAAVFEFDSVQHLNEIRRRPYQSLFTRILGSSSAASTSTSPDSGAPTPRADS